VPNRHRSPSGATLFLGFVIALGNAMAQVQTIPATLDAIVRPPCSHCGAKTWITRIEPTGEPGRDQLTFECPICEIIETAFVKHK
jgi:hypothetical protein